MRKPKIMQMIMPIKSCLLILVLFAMANLLEVTHSQPVRPLCYTQISAASQACSFLYPETNSHSLVKTNGTATNSSKHDHAPSRRHHHAPDDDEKEDDDDDDDEGDDGGDDDDDGGDDDDHGGDDDDHGGDDDDHDDDHHHRRRRHKRRRHHESRTNKECCRWLSEVDNDCVCEALLKLPTFLVKPQHKFEVRVGRSCRLTYQCPGILTIRRHRRHLLTRSKEI